MDGYREQLEKEYGLYGELEKNALKEKMEIFNKLRYLALALNGTGLTLTITTEKDKLNAILSGQEILWNSVLQAFFWGVVFSIIAVLLAYFQLECREIYIRNAWEYKRTQIKLMGMFEYYVKGNNYSSEFSPFSLGKTYAGNLFILQRQLAKYNEMSLANDFEWKISACYENMSLWLCGISYVIFYRGVRFLLSGNMPTDGIETITSPSTVESLIMIATGFYFIKIFYLMQCMKDKYKQINSKYAEQGSKSRS